MAEGSTKTRKGKTQLKDKEEGLKAYKASARPASASSLDEYNNRRDFGITAEPAGEVAAGSGHSFVVQKHDATRLHYDFRLELDGVLKSWAVTKGPSLDPQQKRLAVHTEDHPLPYGKFEGTIPKGQYGGGTVMLWDFGTWEPLHDPREGLEKGMLHFILHGERMRGGWAMVRMPPRGRDSGKHENWLLIKERDGEADEADPILAANMVSVTTGRTMEEIATGESPVWDSTKPVAEQSPEALGKPPASKPARKKAAAAKTASGEVPEFRSPQLATLVDVPPEGRDWVHELKYDGYRTLIAANGDAVRCYTRNGLDWTAKFGPVVKAIAELGLSGTMIDGEIVAFAPDGRTDFSTLQKTLKEGGELAFFAFDLLTKDNEDVTGETLLERKARLKAITDRLPKGSPVHFSDHVQGQGEKVLNQICAAGHEGIISKKASAPYRGARTKVWYKIKCIKRQEFVIGGWSPSEKRHGFRSLLVGTWNEGEEGQPGKLVYAGRVGTGFNDRDLQELGEKFEAIAAKTSPFAEVPRDARRGAKWVEPKLVAEIAFTEFTADGVLRHPSFLGLREDKTAREVHIETPAPMEEEPEAAPKPALKKAPAKKAAKAGSKPASALPPPSAPLKTYGENEGIERAGIKLSSAGKVLFPGQGVSKGNLADYYEAVSELMLPHVGVRPLSLVRCPQGRGKHCFFQKHDTGGFNEAIHHMEIVEGTGASGDYFYVDDLPGIMAGVQMGVMEWHVWGSRTADIEKPDRLVFDLDPDEGLGFEAVRTASVDLRDRLAEIGLKTYPMLSGGKGVHVIAPLVPKVAWPEAKTFCKAFAVLLGEERPDRYVANMSKARRKGRIFVDYLRNERGSTAIAPYSTRSREGAPVSAPVTWEELERVEGANIFNVANMPTRVKEVGDPWPDYASTEQSITKAMMKAVKAE
ncbi:ATP-dependent DNA ligase LigD phosphoesterase module /ATP-dependent DNA ligase LigD polymerase module [Faunimonas pinastri]|uniref:DNA ligase (ATP) n=1 Tax=Faunimonas pinastri TaxID=1855383 RepID=A0A1H9NTH0_9HYPH|nr:DNA ligase D [Faunimonas pinastri]SER38899.1 ATP-dependent DNA ligase LigD phosphoesterase module /ATP-dependent DNA ligase LigD polymerase module [Faunimonas pinastri]